MANFGILMRETKADYVLFADHDDVWKPEKVELTLRSLKDAEAKYGKSTPIYFATDFAVVNKDLELISPSYWKWKRLNPSMMGKLSQSLICVSIQGMASGINRALLDLANPVSAKAISHDWWTQLIAAAMGKVICDPTVTALYRVHGGNASGPKPVGVRSIFKTGIGRQLPTSWSWKADRASQRSCRRPCRKNASRQTENHSKIYEIAVSGICPAPVDPRQRQLSLP